MYEGRYVYACRCLVFRYTTSYYNVMKTEIRNYFNQSFNLNLLLNSLQRAYCFRFINKCSVLFGSGCEVDCVVIAQKTKYISFISHYVQCCRYILFSLNEMKTFVPALFMIISKQLYYLIVGVLFPEPLNIISSFQKFICCRLNLFQKYYVRTTYFVYVYSNHFQQPNYFS